MTKQLTVAVLTALIAAGCGREAPEQAAEGGNPATLPQDNVFRPYVDNLERARGVEETLQQGADRQRRLLEEQGY